MYYGVSYYPEHKNEEDYEHDMKLIIESGINTVRMGEFAWCRFEPSEGQYNFDWLDRVVDMLNENGIKTIVCTPTACPPAWLIKKHPDILYVDNRGVTRPFGGRRHYCYNNEIYREYSAKITTEIAKHYGKYKGVLGFQIDNELAQELTGRCSCPVCQEKFRDYLKKKYGTIENLNRTMGTIFWSQEYDEFSEITIPVNTIETGAENSINAFYESPSIRLEYERFASKSQIEFQNIQTDILRKYSDYFVTTNATGLATNSIDNYKSTEKLDNYAFDYYPSLRDSKVSSFPYSFARGVKQGEHFWVLEFMSGGGHKLGGMGRLQPNPNALKQAVVQSFAQGSDLMLHFQFRTFPSGAEQLNYSIVDMDGVPRRRYREMCETAKVIKKLEKFQNAGFDNKVAVCFDYDTDWALKIKPVNKFDFDYLNFCEKFYNALADIGVNCDVISLNDDFTKYRSIILPTPIIFDKSDKLKDYVAKGGVLLGTFLTSVKDSHNVGYTKPLPCDLNDLFGITVTEVEPVFDYSRAEIQVKADGVSIKCRDACWSELLEGNADMIGRYLYSYKKGNGVISKNKYSEGYAYYLGTDLENDALKALLNEICSIAGIQKNRIVPQGNVEVVKRIYNDAEIYYVFNFTGSDTDISFNGELRDCISDTIHKNHCTIEPNGFVVLGEVFA